MIRANIRWANWTISNMMSKRFSHPDHPVQPLPFGASGDRPGLRRYVISLGPPQADETPPSRAGVVRRGTQRTEAFLTRLRQWVHDSGMDDQVSEFGEPMAFPMVTVTCTPAVAERIERLPEVEAVMPDEEAFGIVR